MLTRLPVSLLTLKEHALFYLKTSTRLDVMVGYSCVTTFFLFLLLLAVSCVSASDEWIVYPKDVQSALKEAIGEKLINQLGAANVERIASRQNGAEIFIVQAEENKIVPIRSFRNVGIASIIQSLSYLIRTGKSSNEEQCPC